MNPSATFPHTNGFVSLKVSLVGLENEFELGIKFEERESHESRVDLRTGIRAWAEPFLALYVSASPKGSTQVPVTLSYARTRSFFGNKLNATADDRDIMLQAATPFIMSDLTLLAINQSPQSLGRFTWV